MRTQDKAFTLQQNNVRGIWASSVSRRIQWRRNGFNLTFKGTQRDTSDLHVQTLRPQPLRPIQVKPYILMQKVQNGSKLYLSYVTDCYQKRTVELFSEFLCKSYVCDLICFIFAALDIERQCSTVSREAFWEISWQPSFSSDLCLIFLIE